MPPEVVAKAAADLFRETENQLKYDVELTGDAVLDLDRAARILDMVEAVRPILESNTDFLRSFEQLAEVMSGKRRLMNYARVSRIGKTWPLAAVKFYGLDNSKKFIEIVPGWFLDRGGSRFRLSTSKVLRLVKHQLGMQVVLDDQNSSDDFQAEDFEVLSSVPEGDRLAMYFIRGVKRTRLADGVVRYKISDIIRAAPEDQVYFYNAMARSADMQRIEVPLESVIEGRTHVVISPRIQYKIVHKHGLSIDRLVAALKVAPFVSSSDGEHLTATVDLDGKSVKIFLIKSLSEKHELNLKTAYELFGAEPGAQTP